MQTLTFCPSEACVWYEFPPKGLTVTIEALGIFVGESVPDLYRYPPSRGGIAWYKTASCLGCTACWYKGRYKTVQVLIELYRGLYPRCCPVQASVQVEKWLLGSKVCCYEGRLASPKERPCASSTTHVLGSVVARRSEESCSGFGRDFFR